MTTIVWDGITLATDSKIIRNHFTYEGEKARWVTLPTGETHIVSGVGDGVLIELLTDMYQRGLNIQEEKRAAAISSLPNWRFIVIAENGLKFLDLNTDGFVSIGDSQCAFGSGADFAYGALEMGASAHRAVEVAIKFDPGSGGAIETYRMPK